MYEVYSIPGLFYVHLAIIIIVVVVVLSRDDYVGRPITSFP